MRKIFHRFFTVVSIVFVSLLMADAVKACSCGPTPTIDVVYEQAPSIAILKVESVEKFQKGEVGFSEFLPNQIKFTKLRVTKVFKGNLQVGQELPFASGNSGNCGVSFPESSVGKEGLYFLASQPTNRNLWEAGYCWRARSYASQYTDLSYLNNLEKVKGKTRLSGMVIQVNGSALEGVPGTSKAFANQKVKVIGNGNEIELTTDKNGVFEVYDLPIGKYELKTEGVAGYKLTSRSNAIFLPGKDLRQLAMVEIKPNTHAEIDLVFEIDNSITGKLLDSNGQPHNDVSLNLRPAKGKEYQFFYKSVQTNKDGSFKFETIPPGEYLIEVNQYGYISGNSPFSSFFYPNDKGGEKAIKIETGQHVKDLLIVPPSSLETIKVSGQVTMDKNPDILVFRYASFKVWFESAQSYNEAEKKYFSADSYIEKDGSFSINLLKGQKGKLFAIRSFMFPDYAKCQNTENDGLQKVSNVVEIDGNNDVSNIELKIQLPSCKK